MKLDPEVAYLLGALRDSTIDIRKGKNYEIKIAQKESEWLSVLQGIFLRHFNNAGRITQHSKDAKILRITGKETTYKILEISQMKVPQVTWKTPKIIQEQKNSVQLQYLRGFFDAEGGLPRNPETAKQKYISFSQKNKESLQFLRALLINNGFRPTNLTICGGVWEFRLTRKNDMANFSIKVGSLHKDKQWKLKILERDYFPQFGGGALPGVEAAV